MSGARGPPLEALIDQGVKSNLCCFGSSVAQSLAAQDPDTLFELIDEIAQGSYGHVFNVSLQRLPRLPLVSPASCKAIYIPQSKPCALKIIALEVLPFLRPVFCPCCA